jgi:hypothetical protein
MTTQENELKRWFEANYLDGDEIQEGQMLSAQECFDALTTHTAQIVEGIEGLKKARQFDMWIGVDPEPEIGGFNQALYQAIDIVKNKV